MLTILLDWIYVSLLCCGTGFLCLRAAVFVAGSDSGGVPMSLLPFLGLAGISALTALISIFAPISWQWNILFIALVVTGLWSDRKELFERLRKARGSIRQGWVIIAVFALGAAFILLKSASVVHLYGTTDEVFHSDTGYYHAPSIRWIEEYGIVPGLGNLLPPLAIDYLWFQPCALFGFRDFLPQRLHALTGLITLWALAFSIGGVWGLFNSGGWNRIRVSDLYRTLLLLPLSEVANYIVSDSGDEPAAIMILISIGASLILLDNNNNGENAPDFQPAAHPPEAVGTTLFLICFAVGIKLSALPLLILGGLLVLPWLRSGNYGFPIFSALIVLLVLGPKIARSVFLSGYALYPLPGLDLFHVDWKMPAQVLVSEKAYVASMARIRFVEPGRLLSGGMAAWFGPWLKNFLVTPSGVGAICAAGSMILAGVFRRDFLVVLLRRFWQVHITVCAGVVYWFVMAPDVRFGYGFLAAGEILCLSTAIVAFCQRHGMVVADAVLWRIKQPVLPIAILFVFVLINAFSIPHKHPGDFFGRGVVFSSYYWKFLGKVIRGRESARFLIFQDPYPSVAMRLFQLGDLKLWRVAKGMRCWDASLPSTPFLHTRIEQRGKDLASGFRPCIGPVGDFSGARLAEEYQEALARQKKEPIGSLPSKNP